MIYCLKDLSTNHTMLLHTLMHHPLVEKLRTSCSRDTGLFVLRLVVGLVFIYHGQMKLGNMAGTVMFFGKLGIPAAGFFAPFVSWVECLGGAALILGFGARLAGLALSFDMLVAIMTTMKMNSKWGAHELELLLFAGSLLFLLQGAGCVSIDNLLMKRSQKEHQDAMPAKTV